MSKTTTYTCDRCRRLMPELSERWDLEMQRKVGTLSVARFADPNRTDLCRTCGDMLLEFLRVTP